MKTVWLRVVLVLVVVFFIASCSSTKKQQFKEEKPEWVKRTPTLSSYYVGIGMVNKSNPNYRETATKIALDNIANDISVNIKAESVLHTLETTSNFQQEFKQQIQLTSNKYLEGYEMVDSFEDNNNYYVYYRLSKAKYLEVKQRMLEDAKNRSMVFVKEAAALEEKNDYRNSIISYAKALDAISEYLDQTISVDFDGNSAVLPLEIMRRIRAIENSIQIVPSFDEETFVYGSFVDNDKIHVNIQNKNGEALSSMPLIFEHKAKFTKTEKVNSNNKGKANYILGKVKNDIQHQTIKVSLNIEELIHQATKNKVVRELMNIPPSNEVVMKLNIRLPRVFVIVNDKLTSSANNALLTNRFEISKNKSDADLIMEIKTTELDRGSKQSALGVSMEVSGSITVKNMDNSIVYTQSITTQRGIHNTKEMALVAAYDSFKTQLSRRVIPLFANQYFNN